MAVRAYQPPAEVKGERLDVVLSQLDSSYSRSSWQKLIKLAHIKIDGNTERDPAAKYGGGLIEFDPPELMSEPPVVPIIYEDEDVIVLDKPAGMLTHAKGQLSEEWTLADVVAPKVKDDDTNRPGIVHRLDRDTSGVIMVAKRAPAKTFLQKQFARRQVEKRYLALVEGVVDKDFLSLDWPLARHPAKPSQWTTSPTGKPALTKLKVKRRLSDTTLVELEPKTGRTHQLRVHLHKLGHSILGDRLYGQPNRASRLMLHAQQLVIKLPSGQSKTFTAPLPLEFEQELKRHE